MYTHAYYNKNGELYQAEVKEYVDTPHILSDIRCNDRVRESMTKHTDHAHGFVWIVIYSDGTVIRVTPIALRASLADAFEALLSTLEE